jgi:hypothetical protein
VVISLSVLNPLLIVTLALIAISLTLDGGFQKKEFVIVRRIITKIDTAGRSES